MSVFILERPISPDPKTGKPRTRWHVRWAHDETYTYLGSLQTEKLAKARKTHVEALVAIGAPVSLEMFKGKPAVARMRLDQAADKYVAKQATGWAESTYANNLGYRKAVLAYWGGHRDPQKITVDEAAAWLADMKRLGRSANYQRLLKVFMAGTMDAAGVKPNPFRDEAMGKIRGKAKRKALPTVAQLAATREYLDPQARIIFDLMEHSGMRPGEARELTWEQIDNGRDLIVGVGTKTDYERTVSRLDFQPSWIPLREGRTGPIVRMSEGTFYGRLAKASEKAGYKFNPNLLRHVHASRLLAWKGTKHDMAVPDMAFRMGHSHEHFMGTYTHRIAPLD